ncbi:hypothetical protein Mal15_29580 [Stieleria maiorica]|uniref:Uncharacterized protein n=1 Tax=Stieleria maiorica TaxID=2795974 RepID=A0A5B9MFV4_9BACT|nr:hypothetical protein [Stieleria maiorica]QEF98900.1 hypothetical protein Mal15_29580 [Stieleria maiorica]
MKFEDLSPTERLIAEQAVLHFRELNQACSQAADGTVLGVAEELAMRQGRELIRLNLERSLEQEAIQTQKKGRRAGPARAE